ncbi:COG4705 family protein [Lichenifustis flavocetrariae]|uniref:Membrane-anchored protein n=1 Tax=Lichenifustis flavocetrariae TaxID=2949735 RepID=A0AA42CS45_9HYPH|nr:hypothetical protein [Lichenifustis flavocetrariae]MCW6513115.1 hypothetical protein [Lichenifustis flavocetrariae]
MVPATSASPTRFNKVPQVTIWFWIVKVLATTVGETGADLLTTNLRLGLTVTSWIMTGVFLVALVCQVRADDYRAPLYWITVVLISVVGTLISDNLVDGMGISLVTTSVVFAIILSIVFAAWYRSEGTLSIHSIVTRKRELFYWAAILFTFALGTSVGDLLAERLDLGYGAALVVFAAMIAAVAVSYYIIKLDEILCFWAAYVLTRPLGASTGDLLAKPQLAGGWGWGTVNTSLIFLAVIAAVVVYLTISKADHVTVEAAQS